MASPSICCTTFPYWLLYLLTLMAVARSWHLVVTGIGLTSDLWPLTWPTATDITSYYDRWRVIARRLRACRHGTCPSACTSVCPSVCLCVLIAMRHGPCQRYYFINVVVCYHSPSFVYPKWNTHTATLPFITLTTAVQPVATCRQSPYFHKPAIVIVTSFSLWRRSLLSWPRPPLRTYVRTDTLPRV